MKRDAMNQASKDDLFCYLRTIPKLKIKDGKSLIELATYDGLSMWWFASWDFNEKINQFVKSKSYVGNRESLTGRIIGSSFSYFIYEFFTSFLYKLHIRLYKKTSLGKNKILVVTANRYWGTIRDPFTKELKKGDVFFGSIMSFLKKNAGNGIITTSSLGYPIHELKQIMDRRRTEKDISHKPPNIYWSFNSWKKGRNAKNYFSDLWKSLRADEKFNAVLKKEDINSAFLERILCYYFTTIFGRWIEHIEMAKRMIEKERPKLILMETEFANFQRTLVIAGKQKGIPVLAVQHGVITPTYNGYIYAKEDISPEGSVKSPYCPIPDKTVVYGQYDKDILTKLSAYPEDSVVVTGSPRYDIIYQADKIYDKNKICKQLNLDQSKKMILWTTQTHGLPIDENDKNISAVYNAVKSLKNVQLVIKLHPAEDQKASLYTKDKSFEPVIIGRNADTLALIFTCDLLIARYSTTVMEAVALNKPVIILNLSGEPDPVDYVKEDVALGVYKEEDLTPAFEKLLKDDSELAGNRKKYIEKHLYKIDGKATERVVTLLEQQIQNLQVNEGVD
jgi:hypothetical protein